MIFEKSVIDLYLFKTGKLIKIVPHPKHKKGCPVKNSPLYNVQA
ncbi:hypothetical protein FLA_5195 [Filimonas lacunae]|nr:hypothetical protein FLA_5195 [Filimonas lacunae]